jgi:hypothetical protein
MNKNPPGEVFTPFMVSTTVLLPALSPAGMVAFI